MGLNTIVEAIRQDGPVSVDAVGVARRADTNCGSCLPGLDRIVRRELASKAA